MKLFYEHGPMTLTMGPQSLLHLNFHILFSVFTTEDGRSTSVCLLYGQLSSQSQMANFPAFIASKSMNAMKPSYSSNDVT